MRPFPNSHKEAIQSHLGSRSPCSYPPCSLFSSHTSPPPTYQVQVYSCKFALVFTVLGLLGFSRFLPGPFSLFVIHLNCHCLREASPDQPTRKRPYLYHYPTVSTLSLSFSKINFLCLLFHCLFLTSLLGFKIHENRSFVYFSTSPARNNGWHIASA